MISRVYRLAQLLSLDIVIGVVILLRFFCAQSGIDPGWEAYVLLGITVWLIYTIDHLRDAERAANATRERYVFHRKNHKLLKSMMLVMLLVCFILLFFIPMIIFLGGLVLAIFSMIYLLVQHKLSSFFLKELYVAVVYSLGVLLVPILLSGSFQISYLILLFLMTFTNLILFSWYEKDEDAKDGFMSIATQLRGKTLEGLIGLLLSTGLGLAILLFDEVHLYFGIGFLIYSLIYLLPHSFKKYQLYRTIGDGVFLLPILFEWL